MKVIFRNWKCAALGAYYKGKDNKAIILYELVEEDGKPDFDVPVATSTLNMDIEAPKGSVFIKEYSENAGMTDALVQAGIIELPSLMNVKAGFVTVHAYKLTEEALKELW